ncbi:HRDC domain-containing protein [Actinotignum urinale]|uniref:HRDC domain-containing protein n=1 Tax=Actinotignum urinale TaxID=190146 RepID=UPI00280B2905|nr:HRDC domain-containing protein [Actinotignum urinale]
MDTPRGGLPELTTRETLPKAIKELSQTSGPFAIDTERAMGIRYSNRAYLIQIKRGNGKIYLVDPIETEDLMPALAEVLSSDQWILHAADQDLPSLAQLGLTPLTLFDTEMAALLLGEEHISLQAQLMKHVGVHLAKEHSNSDWSKRPLNAELRAYAALDVEFMVELRDALIDRLDTMGRLEWCHQECEEIRTRKPKPPKKDPWRRFARGANITNRRKLGILRELWEERDAIARDKDISPGKVLNSQALALLAAHPGRSLSDVKRSPVLRREKLRYLTPYFWEAIRRGWNLTEENLPPLHLESEEKYPVNMSEWSKKNDAVALRWEKLRPLFLELAEELGIRQEVLMKPARQRALAWKGWDRHGVAHALEKLGARPWQIELTAPYIEEVFRPS